MSPGGIRTQCAKIHSITGVCTTRSPFSILDLCQHLPYETKYHSQWDNQIQYDQMSWNNNLQHSWLLQSAWMHKNSHGSLLFHLSNDPEPGNTELHMRSLCLSRSAFQPGQDCRQSMGAFNANEVRKASSVTFGILQVLQEDHLRVKKAG